MENVLFPINSPESLVALVDKIEEEFWPKIPNIIYQVAGAGSRENAMQLARQYVTGYAEGAKGLLWSLSACVGLLGGIAGYAAGNYFGNHWDIALTLFGSMGGFFGTLIHSPRRIDIAIGLAQDVIEGRYSAVPAPPEPEEEVPFEIVRGGNRV